MPGRVLSAFIQSSASAQLLRVTHVDWHTDKLLAAPTEILELLTVVNGLGDDRTILNFTGIRLLGNMQVDLETVAAASRVAEKFQVSGVLAKGSNSIALKATNRGVGRTVVIKVLRPGHLERNGQAIRGLGLLENISHLVTPVDAFVVELESCSGDLVPVHCVVFPFVNAITLEAFVRTRPPVDPYFFEAFIRQVGSVLEELERRGSRHGDLHARNILVSSEDPSLEFTVIDPSGDLAETSPYGRQQSDLDWFKEHLSSALVLLQRQLPTVSTLKYLGPRLFSVVHRIVQTDSISFNEILRLLDANSRYQEWVRLRASFIEKKFKEPPPLALLRWEEIADPAQALELFEPYPEFFRRVRTFGNSLIVGARGSGKSTYLAALAYFPGAKQQLVDRAEVFGVLFSCRQGEFKQLSSDFLLFGSHTNLAVKHVLVLKIVRHVLRILADAVERAELTPSTDAQALHDFIRPYMMPETITRVRASTAADLSNLAAGVIRWEESEIWRLFQRTNDLGSQPKRLDEHALLTFCGAVRRMFGQLATTQFYFLFDDAGEPNIPRETQHVLNDLLTSSNAVYCVKLSAERFSYDLLDSHKRTLEETHDLTSFDIAKIYATEGAVGQTRSQIKDYFNKILRRRLSYWNYPSDDIADFLGDQLRPGTEMIPVRDLVRRLAAGRKNAYYAGWEVVWQLADKTARNLIEIVSEIFAGARVRPPEPGQLESAPIPQVIAARIQNRAVRAVSTRRLRALEFIPGQLIVKGQTVPLGKHLYNCASYFGAVSHRYLTQGRQGEPGVRLDERLAIERNDSALLREDAQLVINYLVRYGVFDDSGLNVAFDDGQRKPVYVLNRIFCPTFGISFRRDAHLRLSTRRLEEFLLDPAKFAKDGTAFLRNSSGRDSERGLWDDEES
ncbi:MAG: protein kinase [Bryobacteraceae bacterium]